MELFSLKMKAQRIVRELCHGPDELLSKHPNEYQRFTDYFGYTYGVYSGDGVVLVMINNVLMRIRLNRKNLITHVVERVPKKDKDYSGYLISKSVYEEVIK